MSAAALAYAPEDDEDEATRMMSSTSPALAAYAAPPTKAATFADGWFVGIAGSPQGPFKLADLRSKVASGEIGFDALVWREGQGAWQPLKTFPELKDVVEGSSNAGAAALAPGPSVAPAGSQAPAAIPATAPALPESAPPLAEIAASPGALAVPAVPAIVEPAPERAASSLAESAVITSDLPTPGLAPRFPVAAWAAIFVALVLGFVIAFVFSQKEPERVIQYVQVPAPVASAPAPVLTDLVPPPPVEAAVEVEKGKGQVAAPPKGSPGLSPRKGPEKQAGEELKGLSGLSAPGPSDAPSQSPPTAGAAQLDGAQVQSTVARYSGSVKRSCWQPALDSRDLNAPTSARVNVTITIGPSGSVQSATTSGDPRGYPGLASCIAARVRAWQFPPSSSTSTFNVPFVFAAQ